MTSFKVSFVGATALGVVVGLCAIASADAFDCKTTETQPECHARLKCHADEEVQQCQKRLRAAAGNAGNNNGGGGDRGGGNDRGNDDRGGNDRGGNDRGGNDRGNDDRGGRDDDDRGGRWRDDDGEGRGRGRRRRGGGGGGGGGGFEANKTFGLGLELGEPTGLNGKVFAGPKLAVDFGLGYIYRHYYYDHGGGTHVYADLLFHPARLASTQSLEIPFYIGPGLRYWDFTYCVNGLCDYGGSAIGIRVPIGISFDFNNVPLDIFVQIVPTLDFLSGDYYNRFRDRNHFGADFSVGLRFWFK